LSFANVKPAQKGNLAGLAPAMDLGTPVSPVPWVREPANSLPAVTTGAIYSPSSATAASRWIVAI